MHTKLVVDQTNTLQELNDKIAPFHPVLKKMAVLLSYIFHPIFIPLYIVYFLLFIYPFLFAGFSHQQSLLILLQAALMYTFFPLITVLLLKALHFIDSITLKNRRDRIIPFIASNIWYFWMWYVWRNLPGFPIDVVLFAMSIFIASSLGLLFNIFMKISMHAIGLGTAMGFLCALAFTYPVSLGLYLSISLIISGLVCTARLLLNEHTHKEIYWGLATGVIAVMIASWFY